MEEILLRARKCVWGFTVSDEKIEVSKEELENLVDRKVEEKLQLSQDSQSEEEHNRNGGALSRRSFLKKLGFGAFGLAALSSPVSAALNVRDTGLNAYTQDTGETLTFDVDNNGNVSIPEGNLTIKDNTALHAGNLSNYDATQLSGNNGTNGQILQTDGNNTTWNDINAGVPAGVITMWSGTTSDVPSGWTLCDGNDVDGKSVPDLRDRFVVGAGGKYTDGETGGEDSVSLTESEMPSHRHGAGNYNTDTDGYHSHNVSGNTDSGGSHSHSIDTAEFGDSSTIGLYAAGRQDLGTGSTGQAGSHDHNINTNTDGTGDHSHNVEGSSAYSGDGSAHENRPSYYSVAFIMKL